jgi:hypothetical protein
MPFIQEQIQLRVLSQGLKYNLHYERKNWIHTLGLEAETVINNLGVTEQYYGHAVAKQS